MTKRDQGFSLIELLIVIAIIGIVTALAIPSLQRARQNAQAGSAIQSVRTITTAENLYERSFRVYATMADLAPQGTIDTHLASGTKSGYGFAVSLSADSKHFTCTAEPQGDIATRDFYFTDDTAVIRRNPGAPADATSDPIPR